MNFFFNFPSWEVTLVIFEILEIITVDVVMCRGGMFPYNVNRYTNSRVARYNLKWRGAI